MGTVKESDVVLEVVDARCPKETRSEKLEKLVKEFGKQLVIVVAKADLVQKSFAQRVKKEFSKDAPTVFIDSPRKRGTNFVRQQIMRFAPEKKDVRVCVVGFPNTGKSTMINAIKGKKSASTAPVPGHTKGVQWVRVSSRIFMTDTPGIIPFGEEMTAAKGFIKPEKLKDPEPAALVLLEKIFSAGNGNIQELYGVSSTDAEVALGELAIKRKTLKKGGALDVERVARKVIQDWNAGKLRAWWL